MFSKWLPMEAAIKKCHYNWKLLNSIYFSKAYINIHNLQMWSLFIMQTTILWDNVMNIVLLLGIIGKNTISTVS